MFGFVERFITLRSWNYAGYWLGSQVALGPSYGSVTKSLKHQELFRRVEKMMADGMPEGYRFLSDPDEVAAAVLKTPHGQLWPYTRN